LQISFINIKMPINKAIKPVSANSKHELALKKLQLKKKKLLEQVAKHKNQLKEFKENIKTIVSSPQKHLYDTFENIIKKSILEILEVLEKVLKLKSLKKYQRSLVSDLKKSFEANLKEEEAAVHEEIEFLNKMMAEKMEKAKAKFGEDLDENYKPMSSEQIFQEFSSEAETEEKKDIRSLYLEIVKQFHPDKFVGSPDEEKYHLLLQKANQAYQINDFEVLINLREEFLGNSNNLEGAENIDQLETLRTRQIAILEKELTILESQLARLKEEIKKLNKSEFGIAYKNLKKINKDHKADIQMINHEMTSIKDSFNDFLNGGSFPEELFEPEQIEPEMNEDFLAQLLNNISQEDLIKGLEGVMNLAKKSQERPNNSKSKKTKKK